MSKKYGLIVPENKNEIKIQTPGKRAAIFDENSDSDDTESQPSFVKPAEKKKVKIAQERAIEEDPTVYQYDEIYDDMEKKRNESKLARKDIEKKPKYISNLLRAADRRKRENERRIERQVQKERQAEGDEFKDKESYVTPSYLKKLEELKELDEKEKREDYLESIGDVTKQGNLDGFYRHLYDQKMNYGDKIKEEKVEDVEKSTIIEENKDKTSEDENNTKSERKSSKKGMKKRQYRTRDESDSDEEPTEIKKEHMPSNLDADSDFSIDSSDSETDGVEKKINDKTEVKTEKIADENGETNNADVNIDSNKDEKEPEEENKPKELIKKEKEINSKPKIDIWKKRTVGEVFEDARKRYFERLALRSSERTV